MFLLPSVPMNLLGKYNVFKGFVNHLFITLLPWDAPARETHY